MTRASNAGYGAEADKLAVQYERVSFAHVHRHTLREQCLPEHGVSQLTARLTNSAIRASTSSVTSVRAKPAAHIVPSSSFA